MISAVTPQEQRDAELRRLEDAYNERTQYWKSRCESRSINANIPATLHHHLIVSGLDVDPNRKIVPVFAGPPWLEQRCDGFDLAEWMQDPDARLKWFAEHPDCAEPINIVITFTITKDD